VHSTRRVVLVVCVSFVTGLALGFGSGRATGDRTPNTSDRVGTTAETTVVTETTSLRSTTTDGPTTTRPPPPLVDWPSDVFDDPIAPDDVTQAISANRPLGSQSWGQTQTNGVTLQAGDVPDQGVLASDGSERLSIVEDPLGSGFDVLRYRINADDPLTVGGIRTETSHYPLPYAQTFWQATRLMHESTAGTEDTQVVFQWHDGDFTETSPGGPVLAFYVTGEALGIRLRHDASQQPTRESSTIVDLLTEEVTPYSGRWQDLIIKARISPFPEDQGFIRMWRNGELIVDYIGPVAFNQPSYEDYAKLGIYHWVNAGNDWDRTKVDRSVYVAGMSIISDPNGTYSVEQIQQHLEVSLVGG
jgi:hypothetical protein